MVVSVSKYLTFPLAPGVCPPKELSGLRSILDLGFDGSYSDTPRVLPGNAPRRMASRFEEEPRRELGTDRRETSYSDLQGVGVARLIDDRSMASWATVGPYWAAICLHHGQQKI